MKRSCLFLLLSILLSTSVFASDRGGSDHVQVKLLSDVQSLAPGQTFNLGVHFEIDSHWHVYWKNPGDSGIATRIEWELPQDFQASSIKWPYPNRYKMNFLTVYGYEDSALFMSQITIPKEMKASTYTFKAKVDWLECEKVCIPGSAELVLDLPVSKSALPILDLETTKLFSEAKSLIPIDLPQESFKTKTNANVLVLYIDKEDFPKIKELYFYPFKDTVIDHLAGQKLVETESHYELWIARSDLEKPWLDEIAGVLVNEEGWRGRGSEKALRLSLSMGRLDEETHFPKDSVDLSVGLALLFAFLGGLILNLMPCVFPVLSFKVLNLVEIAGEKRQRIFAHGLVFSVGVIASFWALAFALIALKSTGHQIGWGFHLQSPFMVALLAMLFLTLTFNLLGFFEVGLSMTRLSLSGANLGQWVHTFGHGVLATVVATPCTAPFMGAALGFALTQSNLVAFLVFTALGLGMSFPYLALSAFPSLIQKLPKPGAWMEKLKKVLSILLFLTYVWLAWVFWLQRGDVALLLFIVASFSLGIASWFYGRGMGEKSVKNLIIVLLFASLFMGLLWSAVSIESKHKLFFKDQEHSILWEDFSPALIESYREAEKIIFLDFTAAWCLSCQVNERVVFSSKKVIEAFERADVKMIKADWTDKDDRITQALANFGRSSIPLYVFYFPGKEPMLLPEIITPKIVLEILKKHQ